MNLHIERLLRAKHDKDYEPLDSLVVVITHRGGEADEKEIEGRDITDVKKNGFFVGETFIPAHRIKRIHSR